MRDEHRSLRPQCTLLKENLALEVVGLTPAFVAVGRGVLTAQAIHGVKVFGTEAAVSDAVLGKVAGVDRPATHCPRHSDLEAGETTPE